MNPSSSIASLPTRIALCLAAAILPPAHAFQYRVDNHDIAGASPVAPQFLAAADVDAFHELSRAVDASILPDARTVAKAFIREHLGIDGDAYVVAHFATQVDRSHGVPDHVLRLTDALMEAFPDHSRHGFFAEAADTVGGINGGGSASPGVVPLVVNLAHSRGAKGLFAKLGRFLWSRTGPGYLYNTFFAQGNVIETVSEDARPLDEAFGIFDAGGFTSAHASAFRLSRLVERFGAPGAFAQLPYVTQLDEELERYWQANRAHWALLARYEFVRAARHARDAGVLNETQYRLAMRGGAPQVPLAGSLTLTQLGSSGPGEAVEARRFDINGYTASDLVRFIASDGSEVMYVPGADPSFVVAANERELRQWVLAQARDARKLDALLRHFSFYDGQDGVFWTGVKHGLENLGDGRWEADGKTIDHANAIIAGDVFEDMRARTEKRMLDDARMQASTAWEAWRVRIDRAAILLGPLGYVPSLAIPVQVGTSLVGVGTGIEQGVDGRTAAERNEGVENTVSTVLANVPIGAVFGGMRSGNDGEPPPAGQEPARPFFATPQRVNGRLGYPLSPTVPPGWRIDLANRLYRRRDGSPGLWVGADAERHTVRLPKDAAQRSDGVLIHDGARYVPLIIRGRGIRTVRVAADAQARGYRILLEDGTTGPLVERQQNGNWLLAFGEHDYLAGSILAEIVGREVTADPRVLHRAGEVLAQLGMSETALGEEHLAGADGEGRPLLAMALGHGFLETLSARLRDPRAGAWSAREIGMLAPIMARHAKRPLAFYRQDGTFELGVSPDGLEFTARRVPPTALRLYRHAEHYTAVLRGPDAAGDYPTFFAAIADRATAAGETAFREALADDVDGQSTGRYLQRMHRLWLEPAVHSRRESQAVRRISRLRHALVEAREPLTGDQQRWLRDARKDTRGAATTFEPGNAEAIALLPTIVEAESALLPAGLDHLLVKDPAILARARREADQWRIDDRHYVRLRHLDGRAQIVETGPERADGSREIRSPGEGANRATGRYLRDRDGMWFPQDDLHDGFALVDPREHARLQALVAKRLPAGVEGDVADPARIVDSIPQPLLRYFSSSLARIDAAPDGTLELTLDGSATKPPRVLAIDAGGKAAQGSRPGTLPPDMPARSAPDTRLILPAPEGIAGIRLGPSPDPAIHMRLLQAERPISAFIRSGFGDRHVRALATTRRLRGMLREDRHIAVVGATPDHVVTLVMPMNADTMAMVGSEPRQGRHVSRLPPGTVILDEMFGISAAAADYPARVREVAREWEARGASMAWLRADGRSTRESPAAFAERLLSTPLRPNLWNPHNDPISEAAYVNDMRRRKASGEPVRHAGLDWLATRDARRDYMSYFAPPFDVMPDGHAPLSTDSPATVLPVLVETAMGLGLNPAPAPATVGASPMHGLHPDTAKEPVSAAGR